MWFMSDPIIRSETESEEDSDSNSILDSDCGDDALVESFFITDSEWIFFYLWFFIYVSTYPPDWMNLKNQFYKLFCMHAMYI